MPSFVAVVPYWAVWPFEVMVLPLRHVADLEGMTDAERDGLGGDSADGDGDV